MVVLHRSRCKREGWYWNRWLTCNRVPKFWCRGDFSHGETSLFCSLELHPLNCKRSHANSFKETTHRLNILHLMPSSGCCMLRPHPVKCRTSQCTTVQRYITVGCVHKCNRLHLTTPNCGCWVWSVVQQTWTFQPVEVSATILTPYVMWSCSLTI